MSASLPALLADELGTSPKTARKLLIAMLREVKKRARREGVRLPDFGTFREENGQIAFEPSPSLARAVNHRFEGLESEDLSTAPERESDEDDGGDEGPNTITLGYQDSDWTPLDSDEDTTESSPADAESDGDEADTEEFQVPAAEEAAAEDAADTEELPSADTSDAASPASPSSPDAPATDDSRTTETEELYPLVEDVPDGDAAEAGAEPSAPSEEPSDPSGEPVPSAADEEHDSLSGIWDDEDETEADEADPDTDFDPFDAAPEPGDETETETEPASAAAPDAAAPASETASSETASTQEVEVEPDDRGPADSEPASSDSSSGGSVGVRVGVGLLVVLLLGGAAWYVLGQRGTVQPPREAFAQLSAQVQPQLQKLSSLVGASSGGSSGAPPSASAEASPQRGAAPNREDDPAAPSSSDATTGTSATGQPSSDEPSSDESSPPPARGLTPSAGGWTIIVASRTQRDAAESLVEKYRTAFADQTLPVGILTGTVDGQTRYRVGVGQFDARRDAQRLLDEAGAKLPQGAWPLRLQ